MAEEPASRSKRLLLLESLPSKSSKLISFALRPPLGQQELRWKLIRLNAEHTKRSSQNALERVCPKPQLSVHEVLNCNLSRVHAAMIEKTTRRLRTMRWVANDRRSCYCRVCP